MTKLGTDKLYLRTLRPRWMDGRTDGCMDEWMDGQMEVWMDRWIDEWDGWMKG